MPEFLLEIGCEEMPAGWLPGLTEQLRQRFEEAAAKEHLTPQDVVALSTPRRLAVRAEVLDRQPDREEKIWGPAAALGRESSAATGFARKNNTTSDQLLVDYKDVPLPLPSHPYFYVVKRVPGRASLEILSLVIAATLRSLAFPKRMTWDAWLDDGKGSFPFGRPIRWMVALLDGSVVPFGIHAMVNGAKGDVIVRSGRTTRGHRFLPRGSAGRPFESTGFEDLRAKLGERFVLLDPAAREARIREGLTSGLQPGEVVDDHGLPLEWRDLVEYPTVVFGGIPAEFRTLPVAVLETVLVHHQKYIPLVVEGRLVSRFAAVVNTDATAADAIVRGMERVVVARLRDAAFFFQEDRKRRLADRVQDLAGVTFHQGLGTYKEKTERVVRLVEAMGPLGYLTKDEHQAAMEAALLAKADLTTLMVRELPELQGVVGAIYLRAEGDIREDVASAVRWHYHPLSVEAEAPPVHVLSGSTATVFAAVSLADKLDTLAGYFCIGLTPSGSSDPYGLRRAAQGAVRVLVDFWNADLAEKRASLRQLIARALELYGPFHKRPRGEVVTEVEAFLLDRMRYVFVARGFPVDEVEAVLGARDPDALDDPHECWARLQALHRVKAEAREDFEHLAVAFKRAKNILSQGQPAAVDAALLKEDAERDLYSAVARLTATDGKYESRLRALAGLRGPVDRFFDDVLVMDEDPTVRANRLGLLSSALSLFYRIADISKLGG